MFRMKIHRKALWAADCGRLSERKAGGMDLCRIVPSRSLVSTLSRAYEYICRVNGTAIGKIISRPRPDTRLGTCITHVQFGRHVKHPLICKLSSMRTVFASQRMCLKIPYIKHILILILFEFIVIFFFY